MACEHFNAARSSIYLWTAQESALLASYRALQHSGQHNSDHDAAENAMAIAANSPIQVSSQACEQSPDEAPAPRHTYMHDSEANQAPSHQDQAPARSHASIPNARATREEHYYNPRLRICQRASEVT
jgi:hypothetical protein